MILTRHTNIVGNINRYVIRLFFGKEPLRYVCHALLAVLRIGGPWTGASGKDQGSDCIWKLAWHVLSVTTSISKISLVAHYKLRRLMGRVTVEGEYP